MTPARNALDDLAPSLRRAVLAEAAGDLTRIRVVSRGRAEILPARPR